MRSDRKMIISAAVILILPLLLCCDEDNEIAGPVEEIRGSDYFPLNTGNFWRYDVEHMGRFSVLFSTIDTVSHPDGALLYIYQQDDLEDSCHFKYYADLDGGIYQYSGPGDTIECFGQRAPTVKWKILGSLLWDGCEWMTQTRPSADPDTFEVHTGFEIYGDGNIFPDCILVVKRSSYNVDSLFYARGVGLVKAIYRSRDLLDAVFMNIDEYSVEQTDVRRSFLP